MPRKRDLIQRKAGGGASFYPDSLSREDGMIVSPIRIGLVFGLFLALFHACWAALVAAGVAQPLIDFVFWAHFITPPYHIEPFALPRALALLAITFTFGLIFGAGGAWLWNRLGRRA